MRALRFAAVIVLVTLLINVFAKDFDSIIRLNGRACADRAVYDTGNEIDGSIVSFDCAARLGFTNNAAGDLVVPAGTPEVAFNHGAYLFYCFDNAVVSALDDGSTLCVVTQRVYIPKNATNPAGNEVFRTRTYLNTGWINEAGGALIGGGSSARGLWPNKVIARSDLRVTNVVVTNIFITNRFIVTTNGTPVTNQVPRNYPFTNTPAWDPWMGGTNYGFPGPYYTNMFPRPHEQPRERPDGWHFLGTNTFVKVNPDGSTVTVTNSNSLHPTNTITPGTNGWTVIGTNNWILTGTNHVIPLSTNGWQRGTNGWIPLGTNGWIMIRTNGWSKLFGTNELSSTNWGGSLRFNTNGYFIDPRGGDFPGPNPFEGKKTNVLRSVSGIIMSPFGQGFAVDIVPGGFSTPTFIPRALARALELFPRGRVSISARDPVWASFALRGIPPPGATTFDRVDIFLELPGLGNRAPVQALVLDDPAIGFVLAGSDFFTGQYAFIPKGAERGLAFAPYPNPTLFAVSGEGDGSVRLRWADMGGNAHYIVEEAASPGGPWLPSPNIEWPMPETGARLSPRSVKSLFYRVRALNWRPF
jgi:hypothetical protein